MLCCNDVMPIVWWYSADLADIYTKRKMSWGIKELTLATWSYGWSQLQLRKELHSSVLQSVSTDGQQWWSYLQTLTYTYVCLGVHFIQTIQYRCEVLNLVLLAIPMFPGAFQFSNDLIVIDQMIAEVAILCLGRNQRHFLAQNARDIGVVNGHISFCLLSHFVQDWGSVGVHCVTGTFAVCRIVLLAIG